MATMRLDEVAAAAFGVTREEAAALIMEGRVWIGDIPADKPGTPVKAGAALTLRQKGRKYASRSGYKLEKALRYFALNVDGQTVCDIGASNGGFTDCLLQNGAARVFAVDVAYGILAWELRQDERVTVMERTNARHLTAEQLGERCDLVTVDVAFISLTKIFPAIDRILKEDGRCVCLIKPQFELKPFQLGKNGMVKDPAVLPGLIGSLIDAAAGNRLYLRGLTVSPIHGTNGNVEYLLFLDRQPAVPDDERERLIAETVALRPDEEG
ncbi:MAG: TlyA family RNA methyltransferase [Acutalibacteraceae bacterium]|jgi:23S rRNA (cytidine1920-2'-O)/16S rRNA (cytidine1409-2'-O)-methyltransferase